MYLFLNYSEGLSSHLLLEVLGNLIKGVKISRGGLQISHLMFADGCVLFDEATIRGDVVIMNILEKYEQASGQCVNF